MLLWLDVWLLAKGETHSVIFDVDVVREALKKRYIVDIDKTGVDRIALKEKHRINLPKDEEIEDD